MPKFLQEIIADENLVWDKSLADSPEKFIVKLTPKTIDELNLGDHIRLFAKKNKEL